MVETARKQEEVCRAIARAERHVGDIGTLLQEVLAKAVNVYRAGISQEMTVSLVMGIPWEDSSHSQVVAKIKYLDGRWQTVESRFETEPD